MVALELGGVIAEGTPEEVLAHPAVIESYLGQDESAINRSGARGTAAPVPVETVPVETVPVETAPVETAPVETAPVDTVATQVNPPADKPPRRRTGRAPR